jgi:hypothetical protein
MPAVTTQPPPQTVSHSQPAPGISAASVVFWLVLTVLIAGGSLWVVFSQAVNEPKPDCVIMVRATEEWDGVELSVDGGDLTEPRITWVEKLGQYNVPFFLWPGKYTLHVKSQGVEIYTQDFDLTQEKLQTIDLNRTGATTLPATNPATMPEDDISPVQSMLLNGV